MNKNNELIELRLIALFIPIVAVYFFFGYILKSYFGYFTILLFIFFYIQKQYNFQLYMVILWLFIHKYFIGLRILKDSPDVTTGLTLFCIFLIFINSNNFKNLIKSRFVKEQIFLHILLAICLILSYTFNHYKILRIPRFFNYFFLFLAILSTNFPYSEYKKILNLIFAIGVFQIPIAFAQYLQIIPAPVMIQTAQNFSYKEHKPDLDDAACGTFGGAQSPDLSFFLSILAIILFLHFLNTKKTSYIFISFFLLLQYLIIDSKTVLFIALVISFFIFFLNRTVFSTLKRVVNIKVLIIITSFFLFSYVALKNYYEKGYTASDANRFEKITQLVTRSVNLVFTNFSDWGKIKGFKHAYILQKRQSSYHLVFGSGLGGYTFENQGIHLRQKTNHKFSIKGFFNNFVDSNSTLIILMIDLGMIGFSILILINGFVYFKFGNLGYPNDFYNIVKVLIKPLIFGVLLYSFIHRAFSIETLTNFLIWILLALSIKLAETENKTQNVVE